MIALLLERKHSVIGPDLCGSAELCAKRPKGHSQAHPAARNYGRASQLRWSAWDTLRRARENLEVSNRLPHTHWTAPKDDPDGLSSALQCVAQLQIGASAFRRMPEGLSRSEFRLHLVQRFPSNSHPQKRDVGI